MKQACIAVRNIVQYGMYHHLLDPVEYSYVYNKLLDLLHLENCRIGEGNTNIPEEPSALLKPLLDYAVKISLIPLDTISQRDIFEAKIMDIIIPRPRAIIEQFNQFEKPQDKTNYFYHLSQKSNYIKTARTSKNLHWQSKTKYGTIEITINLSKPEKDPNDIILQGKATSLSQYPQCLLCKENVGYNGRSTGIGRTNHRIIPVTLNNELFYLQYSPYVYYNEHCIVLHENHIPMNVGLHTFKRLFDFVDQFPHYFLGSNAGLPIVGGSILSHEHYQGGRHMFPIEHASVVQTFQVQDTTFEQLYWPLSVVRLRSKNRHQIIQYASAIYQAWAQYNNDELEIYAYTDGIPHNAITPIARKKDDVYELDITLRNNYTTKEFPLGVFHPHPMHHHIKKENIGLIEVMGLAVLPARLDAELQIIKTIVSNNEAVPKSMNHHKQWIHELQTRFDHQDIDAFTKEEVAVKFVQVLENSGVFKQNSAGIEAFSHFLRGVIHVLH